MNICVQIVRIGPLWTPSDIVQLCRVNIIIESSSYMKTVESDIAKARLGPAGTIK